MDVSNPFARITGGHTLAQAIVDTLREPLLVLDGELRVVAASRSFCETFGMRPSEVEGRFIYLLGKGQWDIAELRDLLQKVLPDRAGMDGFEIEGEFTGLGRRRLLLNARTVVFETDTARLILLAMEDVTAWRAAESAMQELLQQKEILLQEMQHRVANSLQIIASILLIKARAVQSEETRLHLQDAHQRVMSVAAVQEQLSASRHGESVALGPYITRLCQTLASSMIGDGRNIAIDVRAMHGEVQTSDAVSLGLIVTELLINAVKHAFPENPAEGRVEVDYVQDGPAWSLTVSDNGIGMQSAADGTMTIGLGTSIVEALASKLSADVEIKTGSDGTRTTVKHEGSIDRLLTAA